MDSATQVEGVPNPELRSRSRVPDQNDAKTFTGVNLYISENIKRYFTQYIQPSGMYKVVGWIAKIRSPLWVKKNTLVSP